MDGSDLHSLFNDWTTAELEELCGNELAGASATTVSGPDDGHTTTRIDGSDGGGTLTSSSSTDIIDDSGWRWEGIRSPLSDSSSSDSDSDSSPASSQGEVFCDSQQSSDTNCGSQSFVEGLDTGCVDEFLMMTQQGMTEMVKLYEGKNKREVLRKTPFTKADCSDKPTAWETQLKYLTAASSLKLRGLERVAGFNPFEAVIRSRDSFGDSRGYCPLCGVEAGASLSKHMDNHMHMSHNSGKLAGTFSVIHMIANMGLSGEITLDQQWAMLNHFEVLNGEYNSAWKHKPRRPKAGKSRAVKKNGREE